MYVNSFLSFISGSISSTCSRGRLEIESSRIRREKEREISRRRERYRERERERENRARYGGTETSRTERKGARKKV